MIASHVQYAICFMGGEEKDTDRILTYYHRNILISQTAAADSNTSCAVPKGDDVNYSISR